MKRAMRCGYCNMRVHKCRCKPYRRKKTSATELPRQRPPGQSTITWACGPREQLGHWRNNRQHQSSQDRRQSAKRESESHEDGKHEQSS